MINKENIRKWVDALNSGKYRQGKGCLRSANNEFCCLGVAVDLYAKEHNLRWEDPTLEVLDNPIGVTIEKEVYKFADEVSMGGYNYSTLPKAVINWLGFNTGCGDTPDNPAIAQHSPDRKVHAAEFNDKGTPFPTIATYIENMYLKGINAYAAKGQ